VFDLAGAARSFALARDPDGATGSLSRVALLGLFEKAVTAAAERIAVTVNAQLQSAAAESRYLPGACGAPRHTEDTRAIAARLGSGGAGFVDALDVMEQAARPEPRRRSGRWRCSPRGGGSSRPGSRWRQGRRRSSATGTRR
jgi:hypothetical protein